MERSWNCQDSGTDITNKNVTHYHTIVILPQSDFDFSWAAQCSLLRVLKWAFLIMVIIGIFWISIKSRNLFVVFVESMKKHQKDRSQRSAKLLSKISKGFAVFVAMSINVLWLPRTQTSLFNLKRARKGRREGDNGRLYPSHGPLRFITSHSFRARICHAKNEAPEEEASVMIWFLYWDFNIWKVSFFFL